jgi:hypothetical protein
MARPTMGIRRYRTTPGINKKDALAGVIRTVSMLVIYPLLSCKQALFFGFFFGSVPKQILKYYKYGNMLSRGSFFLIFPVD